MPLKGKFVIQKLVKLYENKKIFENVFPPRHECWGQSKIALKNFHHNYDLEKILVANCVMVSFLFDWLWKIL